MSRTARLITMIFAYVATIMIFGGFYLKFSDGLIQPFQRYEPVEPEVYQPLELVLRKYFNEHGIRSPYGEIGRKQIEEMGGKFITKNIYLAQDTCSIRSIRLDGQQDLVVETGCLFYFSEWSATDKRSNFDEDFLSFRLRLTPQGTGQTEYSVRLDDHSGSDPLFLTFDYGFGKSPTRPWSSVLSALFPAKMRGADSSDPTEIIEPSSEPPPDPEFDIKDAADAEVIRRFIDRVTGHDSLMRMMYFSVIVITTTGFGDIIPVTTMTRVAVFAEIIIGLVLFALIIDALTSKRP